MFESPFRRPWQAMSKAIMLLEQAESRWTLGPVKLKNQLSRFANILIDEPVAACLGSLSWSFNVMIL